MIKNYNNEYTNSNRKEDILKKPLFNNSGNNYNNTNTNNNINNSNNQITNTNKNYEKK